MPRRKCAVCRCSPCRCARRNAGAKVATLERTVTASAAGAVKASAAKKRPGLVIAAPPVAAPPVVARFTGRKITMKPATVAIRAAATRSARLKQHFVSICDTHGKETLRTGPFFQRRSAQVEAKTVLLGLARAAASSRGQREHVHTLNATERKQQATAHYPVPKGFLKGSKHLKVTDKRYESQAKGGSYGTYTRLRVSADDGYSIGDIGDADYRVARILVEANAEVRANGKRRKAPAKRRNAKKKNPRVSKTEVIYVLQGHYGYGWEDLTAETSRKEINARAKEYRSNAPGAYRVISRRVSKATGEPVKRSAASKEASAGKARVRRAHARSAKWSSGSRY